MNAKQMLALEAARWLNAVRRDIHANHREQARQRMAFPDKAKVIDEQENANKVEYLKTIQAVENILDPELRQVFEKAGINVEEEIRELRLGAEQGDIDYDPPDLSVLRR